jgi:polysaccharide export outer membrane protein
MAYAFDSTEFGEEQTFADDINQQSEFTVPQSTAVPHMRGYTIGQRDLLDIEVFRVEDLKRTVRVDIQGMISLPLVGPIKVSGKTIAEVERLIEARLEEKYLQDPYVTVFIREYESQKVTINGWVDRPGVFSLKGKTTLIQAMSMAGGIKRLGDPTDVVIFREKSGVGTTGYRINFEDVQAGRVSDPLLEGNDIIVVPENGSKAAFEETAKTLRTFLGFAFLL